MNQDQVAADLGKKIVGRLQEILQREVELAHAVGLRPPAIAAMMIEIAAGMANAAALVAIQMRKDGTSADDLHRHALELITESAAAMRDRGLEKLRSLGGRT